MTAAVVFDLDGTLVDSEPLSREAWRRTLARHGRCVTDEDVRVVQGRTFEQVHAHFAAGAAIPAAADFWPEYAADLFAAIDRRLAVFQDAVGTARSLRAAGVRLGLASSSARERVERTLAAARLAGLFDATVAGDEVRRPKPAPDAYLEAARLLGCTPSRCVAVEDSQTGVDAALAAGFVVVAVCRSPGAVEPRGAHACVAQLTPAVLREWVA